MKKLLMNKFLVFSLFAFLCACSETPLELGANQVMVSVDPPEKGCKFVSQVIGHEGGFKFAEQQEKGAINIIRNEAHKLGANYVRLINNRAAQSGILLAGKHGGGGSSSQVSVTYVGNAYKCPDND